MVARIRQNSVCAVDLEWDGEGDELQVCLVQLHTQPGGVNERICGHAYVLDLVVASPNARGHMLMMLGAVMQDAAIVKVFHGCSADLPILRELCSIDEIKSVLDLQLLHPVVASGKWGTSGRPTSVGLGQLLSEHGFEHKTKVCVHLLMKLQGGSLWRRRPLSMYLQRYAVDDARFLIAVASKQLGVRSLALRTDHDGSVAMALDFCAAKLGCGAAPTDTKLGGGAFSASANMKPYTEVHHRYHDAILDASIMATVGVGGAGCGKTHIACVAAVRLLAADKVRKVVVTRPAVNAGEEHGFLPGDVHGKMKPYVQPIYDAMQDVTSKAQVDAWLQSGRLEVAPLAYMRGRTFTQALVIVDEAQNMTVAQMKMLLTRVGSGSSLVITGDPSQSDRERASGLNGLSDLLGRLSDPDAADANGSGCCYRRQLPGSGMAVYVVRFADEADNLRNNAIADMLKLYA